MAFDIAAKAKEAEIEDEGKEVQIIDIDGEPAVADDGTPVTWTICGINSKQYRKVEAWQRKEFRKIRGREQTAAEHEAHQAEFVARCSLGFKGITENGQPLPFTTANATKALLALPFVRRQLEQAAGDHAGFTKSASIS